MDDKIAYDPHCCSQCSYKCWTPSLLRFHLEKEHKIKEPKAHVCQQCRAEFTTFDELRCHRTNTHLSNTKRRMHTNNLESVISSIVNINREKDANCLVYVKEEIPQPLPDNSEMDLTDVTELKELILDESLIPEIRLTQLSDEQISKYNSERPNNEEDHQFRCPFCTATFAKSAGLHIHMNRAHVVLKKFKCVLCSTKVFKSNRALNAHILRDHIKYFPYLCEVCGDGFPEKRDKERHSLKCHQGSAQINTQNLRNAKLKSQTKGTKNPYMSFEFIDVDKNVTSKVVTKSCEKSDLLCKLCKTEFFDEASLVKHMKRHRKKFTENQTTKSNIPTVTTPNIVKNKAHCLVKSFCHKGAMNHKYYSCGLCTKRFAKEPYLKRHMDFVHYGDTSTYTRGEQESTDTNEEDDESNVDSMLDRSEVKGGKVQICQLCYVRCSDETALDNHLRRHRFSDEVSKALRMSDVR